MDSNRVVVTHLPIVEDGLSSGHASDTDNNNQMLSLQVCVYFIHCRHCLCNINTFHTSTDLLIVRSSDGKFSMNTKMVEFCKWNYISGS